MSIWPDTKYQMMWRGKWRPVLAMFDANNVPTTLAQRAAKVALWWTDAQGWVAVVVSHPGEIVERFDRDPNLRVWDDLDEPLTTLKNALDEPTGHC